MGFARMRDRLGEFDGAADLYKQATRRHPNRATAHNDLGMCCLRQNKPEEALAPLNKAVALDPKNPRYRNNLSTALVSLGRQDEALKHLSVVHPPAVAHYNLGYLLRPGCRQPRRMLRMTWCGG